MNKLILSGYFACFSCLILLTACEQDDSSLLLPILVFEDGDRKNAKAGYINTDGTLAIPLIYDEVAEFSSIGLAKVKLDGKYGFINEQGDLVISARYDASYGFSDNGLAPVKEGGRWAYINESGELTIPYRYDNAYRFANNGLAQVIIDKKFGFIDSTGEMKIPAQYSRASRFDESDLAGVKIEDKWGFIDKSGDLVIPTRFDYPGFNKPFGKHKYAPVSVDGKYGYIDKSGDMIIPFQYEQASAFGSRGLARVKINKKYGFINEEGDLVIPARYDNAYTFGDIGLAPVRIKGKWGYIDTSGDLVIPTTFDGAVSFMQSDFARVKIANKWGLVSSKGKLVIPVEYGYVNVIEGTEFVTTRSTYGSGISTTEGEIIATAVFNCGRGVMVNGEDEVIWPAGLDTTNCPAPPVSKKTTVDPEISLRTNGEEGHSFVHQKKSISSMSRWRSVVWTNREEPGIKIALASNAGDILNFSCLISKKGKVEFSLTLERLPYDMKSPYASHIMNGELKFPDGKSMRQLVVLNLEKGTAAVMVDRKQAEQFRRLIADNDGRFTLRWLSPTSLKTEFKYKEPAARALFNELKSQGPLKISAPNDTHGPIKNLMGVFHEACLGEEQGKPLLKAAGGWLYDAGFITNIWKTPRLRYAGGSLQVDCMIIADKKSGFITFSLDPYSYMKTNPNFFKLTFPSGSEYRVNAKVDRSSWNMKAHVDLQTVTAIVKHLRREKGEFKIRWDSKYYRVKLTAREADTSDFLRQCR